MYFCRRKGINPNIETDSLKETDVLTSAEEPCNLVVRNDEVNTFEWVIEIDGSMRTFCWTGWVMRLHHPLRGRYAVKEWQLWWPETTMWCHHWKRHQCHRWNSGRICRLWPSLHSIMNLSFRPFILLNRMACWLWRWPFSRKIITGL